MLITGEIVSNPADSGAQGSKNGRLIGLRRSAISAMPTVVRRPRE
jgi:hypothetical protein